MKKALLVSIIFFMTVLAVFAYETVIIKFPQNEIWEKAYYKKVGTESILQYVPKGQTYRNWNRAIIVHSYNHVYYPVTVFMANNIALMAKNNPTAPYKYLRLNDNESIAGRCTKDYKGIHSQCEFFRATRAHSGIVSIHYINKDKDDFMKNYQMWYDIIKKAKFMNTYWRNDRILNKSEYYELW
jgi:hypothetical protein